MSLRKGVPSITQFERNGYRLIKLPEEKQEPVIIDTPKNWSKPVEYLNDLEKAKKKKLAERNKLRDSTDYADPLSDFRIKRVLPFARKPKILESAFIGLIMFSAFLLTSEQNKATISFFTISVIGLIFQYLFPREVIKEKEEEEPVVELEVELNV